MKMGHTFTVLDIIIVILASLTGSGLGAFLYHKLNRDY